MSDVPVRKAVSISMEFAKMSETSTGSAVLWNLEVDDVLTVTGRATKIVVLLPCHNTMTAMKVARIPWVAEEHRQ